MVGAGGGPRKSPAVPPLTSRSEALRAVASPSHEYPLPSQESCCGAPSRSRDQGIEVEDSRVVALQMQRYHLRHSQTQRTCESLRQCGISHGPEERWGSAIPAEVHGSHDVGEARLQGPGYSVEEAIECLVGSGFKLNGQAHRESKECRASGPVA